MEQLVFTAFLNRMFGPYVLALLQALHIHPKHPAAPISNSFAMELLVATLLTIYFIAVRARLSVERPGGLQHTMEGIQGFVANMADEVVGHHGQKYVPYLATLGMFILACNLIGLVPGLESPTAVPIVPLGCALLTWFYYHFQGVRTNGPLGYMKHFMGPQDKDMPLVMRLLLPMKSSVTWRG
jgi:F-type H+-transporting ATPase subunit a